MLSEVTLNQGRAIFPLREAELARQTNRIWGQVGESRLVGSWGGCPFIWGLIYFSGAVATLRAMIFAASEVELIGSLCTGRTHCTYDRMLLMACIVFFVAVCTYFFHIDCL